MKRLVFLILGLLVLGLAVIAVVPFLVPNEVYRAQIGNAATKALGREVTLSGDVGLSVFPRISASIKDVTVKNPEGFSQDNMVEAGALRGTVKWGPLLSRRVEIEELSFVDAKVALERLESGEANWVFAPDPGETAPTETGETSGVQASIEKARLVNTAISYNDRMTGQSWALSDFTAEASLQALDQPLRAKGEGRFQDQNFDFELDVASLEAALGGTPTGTDLKFNSALADLTYGGALALGDTPSLDGRFSARADNLKALADFADQTAPVDLGVLGGLKASGAVSGSLTEPQLVFETLTLDGALARLGYSGTVSLQDSPVLDGRFTLAASDFGRYLVALGVDAPATALLEKLDLETRLQGGLANLKLNGLRIDHAGDLLTAGFNGNVALGGRIDGALTASSDDLRGLLGTLGVDLAPGDTLRRFSLNAKPAGTFEAIDLADLQFSLDDVSATGAAGVDLSRDVPKVTATLSMPRLDLSPFLGDDAGPSPQGEGTGWSKDPLDLAGLKVANAALDLKVGTLSLGDMVLKDADLDVALSNGNLNANLANVTAFGGTWRGLVGLDTSAIPALSVDLTGSSVAISDFLSTFAGLDSLSGLGGLSIKATSRGDSLDALVRGLNGSASASLEDGAVRGFNAGQLVRSASDLRSALASGNLSMALSPEAETDFTRFDTALSIRDGVASIDVFKLLNPIVQLDGSGSINLGAQTLDLSIATSVDKSATGQASTVQLNGIPVPFRLTGSWTSPSISPDTRLLQQALTNELRDRATSELSDRIGGELGEGLSGVLGLPSQERQADPEIAEPEGTTPVEDEGIAPAETVAEEEPQTVEDVARDAAREALSDLFGRNDEE